MIIGSHVGFKKDTQMLGAVKETLSYGANAFMFYTGAPQNTKRSEIDDNLTIEALKLMKENNINLENVIVHAPYIVNLANSNNTEFSVEFLIKEIERVEKLGVKNMVLHPGSHVAFTKEEGLNNIIKGLNLVLNENTKANILLETMAGKGTELGKTFEELKYIIDNVKYNDKIKVCLDTCHISDAGYDLNNFDDILNSFDKIIGLSKLACIHINDSLNPVGAHKDRHANIGLGYIGFENMLKVIYNDKLKDIPKILETPYINKEDAKDKIYPPYKFEIEMILNKKFNQNLLEDIRKYYK